MSKQKVVEIIFILAAIATIVGVFWGIFTYLVPKSITNGPTPIVAPSSPTAPPGVIPTSTLTPQPSLPPTEPPTSQPTATSSPILSGPQTLPENTRLACNCSDPVVVTLIKIEIQPDKNRMIWTFTFSNNTPSLEETYFGQLTLEEGNQIKYPTTGEPTYDATGPGIFDDGSTTAIFLQPNETKQVIVTFSFVPYKDTSYTLISTLSSSKYVTFDKVVMPL
jgi:hypothetical protein